MLAVWLLGRVSILSVRYSAVTIWASRNQFPLLQVQIRLFKTEIFLANVWQNQGSDNTSICDHSWPAFMRILKICDCLSVYKSFQTVKRSCTSNISRCHFLEVLRVAFTGRNEDEVFPARVLIIHLKKKYNWRCELWFRTWNMQSATSLDNVYVGPLDLWSMDLRGLTTMDHTPRIAMILWYPDNSR